MLELEPKVTENWGLYRTRKYGTRNQKWLNNFKIKEPQPKPPGN